jgi:hypothetical protein
MPLKCPTTLWIENNWAFGRIHQRITQILSQEDWVAEVQLFDWKDKNNTHRMLQNWRQWDIILGNTGLNYHLQELGFLKEMSPALLGRTVSILHCPVINHREFTEKNQI